MSHGTPATEQTGQTGLAGQTGTGIDRDRPNGRNRTRQPGKRVRRIHRLCRRRRRYARNAVRRPRNAGQGIRPATREPHHTALRRAAGRRQRAEPAGRGFLRTDGIPHRRARRNRPVGPALPHPAYGTRTRPAHRARADSEPADRPNRHRLPAEVPGTDTEKQP